MNILLLLLLFSLSLVCFYSSAFPSEEKSKVKRFIIMWGVPLTAPAFTPIQEQEERDSLPPNERTYLAEELYGRDQFLKEDDDMITASIMAVQARIEEMDATEKADYVRAMEVVPELVQKETNVIMFLRCENYDIPVRTKEKKNTLSLFK